MKLILVLLAVQCYAWTQVVISGHSDTTGSAAVTNLGVALPSVALLNWNTSLSNTPSPGVVRCVGSPGVRCAATYTTIPLALAAAACGDTIVLQNTVYITTATLQFSTKCNVSNWLTITRDYSDSGFVAEGTRSSPCYIGIASLPGLPAYTCASPARHMPMIAKSGAGASILITCSYCRFVGIEFTRDNTYDLDFGLLDFSYKPVPDCNTPSIACMGDQPSNVIFDRCVVHGDAQRQTVRAFNFAGARWVAVLDSYIYDIQVNYAGGAGDAQAYGWGFGADYTNVGFGKFANNFVSASTMSNIFCGAFVEPFSPQTGFDGIPHDVHYVQEWYYKNPLWDTQIGATLGETERIEGGNYGPANDQELTVQPASLQLGVGQSFQFQTTLLNDSRGGTNRTIGNTPTLACGSSDCGTLVTNGEHTLGTGIFASQNQVTYTYTAPASIPSGSTVTITFPFITADDRLSTLGNNRTLTAAATVTVVNSNPTHVLALSPAAPDLQMQPSYSDSNGNLRQFEMEFSAIPNFTSPSTTWSVDGVVGGNATVGTMQVQGALGLYTSPPTTGTHIITATASDGTQGAATVAISKSAPIVGFDLKPNTSKNGWELKCGSRILLENSFAENGWGSAGNGGGQPGYMLLMQSLNQANQTHDGNGNNVGYGPEYISDVTVRYMKFQHFGFGFTVVPLNQALGVHRIAFSNILGDDINYQRWGHGFLKQFVAIQTGGAGSTTVLPWTGTSNPLTDHITFRHITLVGNNTNTFSINNNQKQFQLNAFTWQDSFFASPGSSTFVNLNGEANDCNTAQGSGSNNTETKALSGCFTQYIFRNLALLDNTSSPAVFVSSPIWQPAGNAVGFVNYNSANGGDYRLCSAAGAPAPTCPGPSPFAAGQPNEASDGTDLGADVSRIMAVESIVRSGIRTP